MRQLVVKPIFYKLDELLWSLVMKWVGRKEGTPEVSSCQCTIKSSVIVIIILRLEPLVILPSVVHYSSSEHAHSTAGKTIPPVSATTDWFFVLPYTDYSYRIRSSTWQGPTLMSIVSTLHINLILPVTYIEQLKLIWQFIQMLITCEVPDSAHSQERVSCQCVLQHI